MKSFGFEPTHSIFANMGNRFVELIRFIRVGLSAKLIMRTNNKATILAALLALTSFLAASGQTLDRAKLDQFLEQLAAKNQAMGSLTLARDGQVLYSRAIGYSQINESGRRPLTAATKFRIASIGKTYTAVMIMQLVEEGKLKLTDTLDGFLPQVANADNITIRQLLSHRSGVPNVQREWDPQRNWRNGIAKDEMFALIAKATPEFEPDTKQSYSNSGYFLLTLILEKVTGKAAASGLPEWPAYTPQQRESMHLDTTSHVAPYMDPTLVPIFHQKLWKSAGLN